LPLKLEKLGPFEVIYSGSMDSGIPAVCWTIKEGADPGFSLYDLADRLRNRGWQVPAYPLPANCQGVLIQRALVRHGVTRDLCSLLAGDIKQALGHFRQHPVHTSLTEAEASGFHH
jgi:glutamate decarboxylase